MKFHNIFLFILFLSSFHHAHAQVWEKQPIVKDNGDYLLLKADVTNFDKDGNYCFVKHYGNESYIITKNRNYGKFRYSSGVSASGGELMTFYNNEGNDIYYKNAKGTIIFEPVNGRLDNIISSGTDNNMAITCESGDEVEYYVNGRLVNIVAKQAQPMLDHDWYAFSENGNVLFSYKKNG